MKKAILVISFGTSYNETRKKTIEACEKKIKDAFEDYDFFRAFTSNMIIRKLKKRDNVDIENPIQALDRLYEEGYKEVIVQTLHIICGEEYTKLREQISQYEDKFERITLGRPLLTQIEDYKETVKL
ncbi:sirohydrochlorin cobaltochelatase [[Clostridium] sordellii ATCC 9714]|nr:sirohydrochlorin cobaltochelatase [[Clostridium] sordellii ATCC 9714] [Paeniclostridium sordellii ATCC 9714]